MEETRIPKIIHYCWFGRGKMPKLAKKCIKSWKKILPEYELMLWNEDTFDLNLYPYAREAYENQKFAFVTDVVRMWALYNYGGVYMDTDVEILKPLDSFLHHAAFSGFESHEFFPTGLMASEQGGRWVYDNLEWYEGKHFIDKDGNMDLTTNVKIIMSIMESVNQRIDLNNTFQEIPNYFAVYPSDYFCPCSWQTKQLTMTSNTICIHHFAGSWLPKEIQDQITKERFSKAYPILSKIVNLPGRVICKIKKVFLCNSH